MKTAFIILIVMIIIVVAAVFLYLDSYNLARGQEQEEELTSSGANAVVDVLSRSKYSNQIS